MTLDEHLTCPQCGYDLYGIPEVRCPECGFRYDAAALRAMAASAEWVRLVAADDVIVRSVIAAAFAVPAACDRLQITGWAQFCVIAIAYLAAFLTWTFLRDMCCGLAAIPNLLALFAAVTLAFGILLLTAQTLALQISAIILAMAWLIRLFHWPALSPPSNIRAADWRRSVLRRSLAGTASLITASGLLVAALTG